MSKLLIELEGIEEIALDVLLAGVTQIVTDAWARSRVDRDSPIQGEPVGYAANEQAGLRIVPVPGTPPGECNCPVCTMRRLSPIAAEKVEWTH
jgi:hypothetical protein